MTNSASLPIDAQPVHFVRFREEDRKLSIVERFERQVQLYPDNIAIKIGDQNLTYNELNLQVNQVANQVLEMMKVSDTPVAFLLNHGLFQIIAIFGIIKSKNAYVALDPSFPSERLAFMIADSETPLLITNSENLELAKELSNNSLPILNLDEIGPEIPDNNPGLTFSENTIAALQFTSGSTGRPKGCMVPHKLLMHHVMSLTNRRFINPKDRTILLFSASYAGVFGNLFGTLLNGASLYPYDVMEKGLSELTEFMSREKISIFGSVPSTFRYFAALLKGENNFPDLRVVFLGGDSVLKKDLDLFKQHFSSTCYFENTLAGTEFCTIRSNVVSIDSQSNNGIVPVGYEIDGKEILLLDDEGKQVPYGEVGEIILQSEFIALGYWRRPVLTQERFIPVPGKDGMFRFHTGDIGRMDSNGCLYHLGRKDQQVKIRGHRVEVGEITSALLDSSSIEEAFVKAYIDSVGESQLAAYLVPLERSESLVETISTELNDCLPSYMIPKDFIVLDEIPKTPSGKIDVLKLPRPEKTRSSLRAKYLEPITEVESKLVGIWETLLEFYPIGIVDDFFELGGHSLLALRLISEIEEEFDINVPFAALVQIRTIKDLAERLEDKSSLRSFSHLVALQPLGSKQPLFCVPPSAVTVMIFEELAKNISNERPFYALEYAGMDPESDPHDSIIDMALFNLEKIRSIQPEGPYYLAGMCFGGLVGYEMAKQLTSNGEEVPFLGILDSTHAPYLTRPKSYPIFMFTRFLNQRVLKQKFPIGMAPLKRAMKKFTPEDKFSHRVYDVFTSHNYARVKYVTTPYNGSITLFNSEGSRGDFSKHQWKAVAGGGLRVVSIPGAHAGHRMDLREGDQSFIQEPMVQVLAEKLNQRLDNFQ